MAIDYVLATGCEPQRQLGLERLVALHRTRILARAALAHAGDGKPARDVEILLTVRKPEGDSAQSVNIQTLLDEAAPLDTVAAHCATCPAQLPRAFSCHRRIRYPIPERTEAWLMARLPTTLACTAGALLVRGLGEFGWDGSPTAKLRGSAGTFFESRVPYGVRWQGEEGPVEISSDQLFQMMFMVGPLAPTHSLMLALFCGVIPHDISLFDLKDPTGRARALAAASVTPEADEEIEELAMFLRMLAIAARSDATIVVDG